MKATIKFKEEKIDAIDMIDKVAIPYGGSSRAIVPKEYEYHKVKILILKEKVKANASSRKRK